MNINSLPPISLPAGSHFDNHSQTQKSLLKNTFAALGIVYWDIGTSPLYALQASFSFSGIEATELHILGIISLLLWSLLIVVSLKYIRLVMPVNHNGEGGVLALAAQCELLMKNKAIAIIGGILGIAFFFGDAMHTPAISILSAVEGLKMLSPDFANYIVPLSVFIVFLLFSIQYRGSGVLGKYFGYIMVIWFVSIGLLGLFHIVQNITILKAINPYYGFNYLLNNGFTGLLSMGGVILAITGSEALYADMGHFGSKSIKFGWHCLVLPALACNYLGQGGLLLSYPEHFNTPFYSMVPPILIIPMVILATLSTIIASQSVLSGVFSLGWQAVMLKYFPKLTVRHTSNLIIGQIYIPKINAVLGFLTIVMILAFQSSDNIASAYGLCVASTMLLTTMLLFIHASLSKRWGLIKNILLLTPIFVLDLIFFGCCLVKLFDGAWTAVAASAIVFTIIQIWIQGNKELNSRKHASHFEIIPYIKRHIHQDDPKIPGVGIFFSRVQNTIPTSFAAHVRQNKFIHEKVIFLSIMTENDPKVPSNKHFVCKEVFPNIYQLIARYGYKQIPDINILPSWLHQQKIVNEDLDIWYYMSQRTFIITKKGVLHWIQSRIFKFLSGIAESNTEFYRIPHSKVIDIGLHYKI